MMDAQNSPQLPLAGQVRHAVEIFISAAYPSVRPAEPGRFYPPEDRELAEWLMEDPIERTPPDAPADQVRSYALRIGNEHYPHMKLRIGRCGQAPVFVFTVDAHDAFLAVPADHPDYQALEQLKAHNAQLAEDILTKWEQAGLPTERSYLRDRIRQRRDPDSR